MKAKAYVSEELKLALYNNGIGNGFSITDQATGITYNLWIENNELCVSDTEIPPVPNEYVPPYVEPVIVPEEPIV
jgi:hypothetical protein